MLTFIYNSQHIRKSVLEFRNFCYLPINIKAKLIMPCSFPNLTDKRWHLLRYFGKCPKQTSQYNHFWHLSVCLRSQQVLSPKLPHFTLTVTVDQETHMAISQKVNKCKETQGNVQKGNKIVFQTCIHIIAEIIAWKNLLFHQISGIEIVFSFLPLLMWSGYLHKTPSKKRCRILEEEETVTPSIGKVISRPCHFLYYLSHLSNALSHWCPVRTIIP